MCWNYIGHVSLEKPLKCNATRSLCLQSCSFKEGGCSPKFVIIDDGWQQTVNEFHKEGEPLVEGTQ